MKFHAEPSVRVPAEEAKIPGARSRTVTATSSGSDKHDNARYRAIVQIQTQIPNASSASVLNNIETRTQVALACGLVVLVPMREFYGPRDTFNDGTQIGVFILFFLSIRIIYL